MKQILDANIHLSPGAATAVTLGNFDGLHRGHLALIAAVQSYASRADTPGPLATVFSFTPHPVAVLTGKPFPAILTEPERALLLAGLGLDLYVQYPFQAVYGYSPEAFVSEILVKQLRCAFLAVGEGYRFGKGQSGGAEDLAALGQRHGFQVQIVPHVLYQGAKISSTRIRDAIERADFAPAEAMMSRPYFVGGVVAYGRRIGRTMGFPTVNLIPPETKLLPPKGVYLTRVHSEGQSWNAVTNVGDNPTVGGRQLTVESFLFDFNGDMYQKPIKVSFIQRLRPQHVFTGVEALKTQIAQDVAQAKDYFEAEIRR